MGNFFLNAHSGLRYLILLAGVLTVLYAMYGVASGRAYDKVIRILATSFAGTIHLQILLGLALLLSGTGFQPVLIGHLSMMLFGRRRRRFQYRSCAVGRRRLSPTCPTASQHSWHWR